jgi:hypothetical protein
MDNCSSHLTKHIIGLLSAPKIKILPFPPDSPGIFQMLDLVSFGVFKSIKKRLAKGGSIRVMADHAMHVFKACEAAEASSTDSQSMFRSGWICLLQGSRWWPHSWV